VSGVGSALWRELRRGARTTLESWRGATALSLSALAILAMRRRLGH
jgi:hypothetical protein